MGDIARIAIKIAPIASRHHGNIAREQLLHLGVSSAWIDRQVKLGRFHRVYRGVYAVGRPPTKPIERAAAAVLACGPRAVLSHGSAMTLWGFWRRWDEPFEVTVATDRRPKGIRIHRCSTLLRRDVSIREGVRVTRPARTLLDCAPRMRPKSLNRVINDARRANLVSLDALADVATRNPTHPGAPALSTTPAPLITRPARAERTTCWRSVRATTSRPRRSTRSSTATRPTRTSRPRR